MTTPEKVAVSDNGQREACINRLMDINGIARKTAEAMYEIGIHGYAELIQYLGRRTAQQISAALNDQGIRRPPAFIDREAWARQAQELGGLDAAAPADVAREALTREAETVPEESRDTQLEIGDVQLSVLESTPDAPERRLQAEISFQLSGTGAGELASMGIRYRIEGYTVDEANGTSQLVASQQSQLAPQVLEYTGRQEFGLPDVGRYQFRSVVLLLPPGEMAAFGRGPTFRVVP